MKTRVFGVGVLAASVAVFALGLTGCNDLKGDSKEGAIAVPVNVQSAFAAKYSNVNPVWEAKPYGYEGIFTKDGMEYEAEYSHDGQWLETEYEVSEMQFPASVLDRVRRDYPGYAIAKHEIELTPQGTFYEVEIERGSSEGELYYNDQGNPVTNANEDA